MTNHWKTQVYKFDGSGNFVKRYEWTGGRVRMTEMYEEMVRDGRDKGAQAGVWLTRVVDGKDFFEKCELLGFPKQGQKPPKQAKKGVIKNK